MILFQVGVTTVFSISLRMDRGVPDPALALLLYVSGFVLLCWAGVYVLYRKGVF